MQFVYSFRKCATPSRLARPLLDSPDLFQTCATPLGHTQALPDSPDTFLTVSLSVPPLLFRRFCITAPAQVQVTEALVYMALLTAPAHHITVHAQPLRLRVSCIRPCLNKAGYTNRHKSRVLGRGSNMLGRGSEECHIHNSISHMQSGRSSDAKTARKTPKTPKK